VSCGLATNHHAARPMHPTAALQFIGAAHLIALNFQTIAADND
jgi:hypothetical protein